MEKVKFKTGELVKEMGAILREEGIKVTEKDRRAVLGAFVEAVEKLLLSAEGEASVNLSGKLTFEKKFVPARERCNPGTGEKFMDDAKFAIKVKVGSGLKEVFKNTEVPAEVIEELTK
jgi:nucleoid DNA-binding protein